MKELKLDAKLTGFQVNSGGFESDEKSGCKFKLAGPLEGLKVKHGEDTAKSICLPTAGKMVLSINEYVAEFQLAACIVEYDFNKSRVIIKCDAGKPFNSSDVTFLNDYTGHSVHVDFRMAQKEMDFNEDNKK